MTNDEYWDASEDLFPKGSTVIDVKVFTMKKYYTFYFDIMECEGMIRNHIRTTIKKATNEETIRDSIDKDICILCFTRIVNVFFKCKVCENVIY